MAITRSQIARQLLQQGGVSMVDPRMQRSLEENIARNNAAREINQAMRKPGGLRDLYQKYGFSNPQIDLKFAPFASRNRFMELSKRENLIKEIGYFGIVKIIWKLGRIKRKVIFRTFKMKKKWPFKMPEHYLAMKISDLREMHGIKVLLPEEMNYVSLKRVN